jgi:putative FmdB family regulatory protein
MPIYDYRCQSCGLKFEARKAIAAADPDCPACGGQVEKLILAAPAMHGRMALGREAAMRSLDAKPGSGGHVHGPGCGCAAHRHD